MAERVQIEIEATDAASGILRGITSQFGALGNTFSDFANMVKSNSNFMGLYSRAMKDGSVSAGELEAAQNAASAATGRFYEALAMLVINGLKESINATMEYAGQVRDLSLASGTSAEEASRLIQVLDDYEITAGQITTATRFLTKNGLEPNIETIAKLADEYVKIQDPMERNRFIMENLGRGGLQWANALSQGGDKLRALNGDINENLILNDRQVQQAEEYRLAMDNLSDTWEGFKISIGTEAIPALTTLLEVVNKNVEAGISWRDAVIPVAMYDNIVALKQAHEELNPEIDSATQSYMAMAKAAEQSSAALGSNGEAAAEAAASYAELVAMAERLNDATAEQIKQASYQDLKAKMKESGGEITDEEAKVLEEAGIALGIFSQESVLAAKHIDEMNQMLVDGQVSVDAYRASIENLSQAITDLNENSIEVGAGVEGTGTSGTEGVFGNATGTSGQWVTVPPGYPNDSYRMGLSSGEKYMVQTGAEAGGDTVNNTSAVNNYYGNITMVVEGSAGFSETRV